MRTFKTILLAVGCVAALGFSSGKVAAQPQGGGRGNFDPAAMREQMMTRIKDQMSITNDDEWKVIEPAITKVMDSEREAMADRFSAFRGNRGQGGGRRNRNGDTNAPTAGTPPTTGGRNPFMQSSPEKDELQKAIDNNAPKEEIKAKLAKLRDASAAKEAKVVAAQEDLKKLLTSRQEAVAVLNGLLK